MKTKLESVKTKLESVVSVSELGRYEIVKLVLKWITANRQNESYKRLTQTELINKALEDVMTGVVSFNKIDELKK
jgi:hypothetical protein